MAPPAKETVSVEEISKLMETVRRRRSEIAGEEKQHICNESSSGDVNNGFLSWVFESEKKLLGFCLAFRVVNALLVQTYFNPDEHWQALEVAHRITFGYGHLTWEWEKGIRSYLHPLIFALFYKILAFLRLDAPWFMVRGPRLVQSLFSSVGDVYLYKLSQLVFDEQVARYALFCQFVNWFTFFCITRTLSNCLETVLTAAGLFYWLSANGSYKQVLQNSRKLALCIAAVACVIRPTSAITWFYIGVLDILTVEDKLKLLSLEVLPIGFLVLALACVLDRWIYGSWGFSSMLLTFLPFSLAGIFQSKEWRLSGLIAWVLGAYSILGHKEFRFVLPVLPVALIFSGYSLATMARQNSYKRKVARNYIRNHSKVQLSIIFLVITNVPMALYMSLLHQRGSEDVMYFLAKEAQVGKVKSVLFLMPCHSTPYYSALHKNLQMRFMDCSPSDLRGMPDESDRFLLDPVTFVSQLFTNSSLPSHIVLFDPQERLLKDLLASHLYEEVKRFFHAHFAVDRDHQASVVLYARADS